MKKFWIRLAAYFGGLLALAWIYNAVLLHLHPLEYYYTRTGLLLSAGVTVAEVLILYPLYGYILEHWVLPAALEGLYEEKEGIITEFKEG